MHFGVKHDPGASVWAGPQVRSAETEVSISLVQIVLPHTMPTITFMKTVNEKNKGLHVMQIIPSL